LLETVPKAKFDAVSADLEAKIQDLEAKLADSISKREAEIKTRALEARVSELQTRIIELEAKLAQSMPKAQELKSKVNATVLKVKPEAKTEFEIEIPSKVVAPASFVTEIPAARRKVEPSVLPSRPTLAEGQEYEVTIQGISKRGDGIAKIGDFTVFVPRSEVGSRLKIKIITVDRYARYATARKAE